MAVGRKPNRRRFGFRGGMTRQKRLPASGLRTRVPRLGLRHVSGLTRFTAPPRGAHSQAVAQVLRCENIFVKPAFRETG